MTAIYPGSFDPLTNGHLDIIKRMSSYYDKLIVAVSINISKKGLFSVEERVAMLETVTKDIKNVEVKSFDGLLINFAREHASKVIIRGLRAVTDFEYEFQMALTNKSIDEEIETFFVPATLNHLYLSSSIVREVSFHGGDIGNMVPPEIKNIIVNKLKN